MQGLPIQANIKIAGALTSVDTCANLEIEELVDSHLLIEANIKNSCSAHGTTVSFPD